MQPNNTIFITEALSSGLNRIKIASVIGVFNGTGETLYFHACKWWIEQFECSVIFTRDVGHHTCGWWKNPDYEQCFHLSILFPGGRKKGHLKKILKGLFGKSINNLWIEPPVTEFGKSKHVWHYRLFCDKNWTPIQPCGEVYSTQNTPKGWQSYTELKG